MHQLATNARDLGLQRLRRATVVSLAAGGALVAVFGGIAARSLPGHHAVSRSSTRTRARAAQPQPTPPPLVAAQSQAAPAAPAAPASPPTPSQSAPVAVSGGT